jgi:hypothetical protein
MKGKIISYDDDSTNVYRVVIRCRKGQFTSKSLIAAVRLTTNLNQSLNILDEDKKLRTYDDVVSLLIDFAHHKKHCLDILKTHWINVHQYEYTKYKTVVEAIKAGSYTHKHKSRALLMLQIKNDTTVKDMKILEFASGIAVHQVTEEGLKKFEAKMHEHENELKRWQNVTIKQLLYDRLDAIRKYEDGKIKEDI